MEIWIKVLVWMKCRWKITINSEKVENKITCMKCTNFRRFDSKHSLTLLLSYLVTFFDSLNVYFWNTKTKCHTKNSSFYNEENVWYRWHTSNKSNSIVRAIGKSFQPLKCERKHQYCIKSISEIPEIRWKYDNTNMLSDTHCLDLLLIEFYALNCYSEWAKFHGISFRLYFVQIFWNSQRVYPYI